MTNILSPCYSEAPDSAHTQWNSRLPWLAVLHHRNRRRRGVGQIITTNQWHLSLPLSLVRHNFKSLSLSPSEESCVTTDVMRTTHTRHLARVNSVACRTTTGTTILPVLLMKKPYSYMLTLEEVGRGEEGKWERMKKPTISHLSLCKISILRGPDLGKKEVLIELWFRLDSYCWRGWRLFHI